MKVGIFFGGQSREREISFAGGRTVYDNLNKDLFEAVPIFVDSLGNFILLDWQYIYKGTIRDFYPPVNSVPVHFDSRFQVYIESLKDITREQQDFIISQVGKKVTPEQFKDLFDFAFLALHGPYGEDGNIQGLLEWYNIPYSGSGILPSAIGISKSVQKALLEKFDFKTTPTYYIRRAEWLASADKGKFLQEAKAKVGLPLVIKAPNQGSSIGVSIAADEDVAKFTASVNKSFFIQEISKEFWTAMNEADQHGFIANFVDIRHGLGLPVIIENELIFEPGELIETLNKLFNKGKDKAVIAAFNVEDEIIIESFIEGKEFSCIVIQDLDGNAFALPPTEIIKGKDVFDYRSKYLPGMARKLTPINVENVLIEKIRKECVRLYSALKFNVYARIDGFLAKSGDVFLNDPNTTSGMLPSSFFFHQAAEIGLNPSQFLTYIIRTSLSERLKSGRNYFNTQTLIKKLDSDIQSLYSHTGEKMKVGIIMGGFSSERHISIESGRNIYEKLSSSTKYIPVPVFLTGNEHEHELYQIPINIMLKDNADDIKEKVYHANEKHPLLEEIIKTASPITKLYTGKTIAETRRISYQDLAGMVDAVFIALHGRPGEDGAVQAELEKVNLPYNGSGIESSRITINKYDTNEILKQHGISVAKHRLVSKAAWIENQDSVVKAIEEEYKYPFIAKPSDDGCSSAVKKVKNRSELIAFTNQIFREQVDLLEAESEVLKLKRNEDFPQKTVFLIEELISRGTAKHFLEVTGGLLTKKSGTEIEYEIFEPSETLASGEVLSLEEKFLAGEGQNITPARFAKTADQHKKISEQVRATLKKVAEILNIEGYARIDAFVRIFEDDSAETIIIEVNSLPGMTPATCIFHQTAINGYKPLDFIDAILKYGIQKTKERALTL
jgi:UDP-N-acetylmuramate--alanine ligase